MGGMAVCRRTVISEDKIETLMEPDAFTTGVRG